MTCRGEEYEAVEGRRADGFNIGTAKPAALSKRKSEDILPLYGAGT